MDTAMGSIGSSFDTGTQVAIVATAITIIRTERQIALRYDIE